jgi:RHS repeat-associated protein
VSMSATYLTVDSEILAHTKASAKRDYLPDMPGTTAALLDNTQAKVEEFKYWPFGEERVTPAKTSERYRFSGIYGCATDDASNRISMRARIQRPHHGRWLTVDPVWPAESSYIFANDDPVSFADPTGLIPHITPSHYKIILGVVYGYGNYCGADRDPIKTCHRFGVSPAPKHWDNVDFCCIDHDISYDKFGCDWWKNVSQDCCDADKRLCDCLKLNTCHHKHWHDQWVCNQFRNFAMSWFCDIKPKNGPYRCR